MNFNFYVDEENTLILEWDGIGEFDVLQVIEEMEDDEIEHIVSSIDGWTYLYDRNSDIVYHVDDHYFNRIRDLRDMGRAQLCPYENSYEHYNGYEWNEGRKWTAKEMGNEPKFI